MLRISCCWVCYFDVTKVDWNMTLFFEDIHFYQCPFCKSWYTCYHDGTIKLLLNKDLTGGK